MSFRRLVPGLLALSYLSCLAGCDAGSSSGDDSTSTAPAMLLGCTVTKPAITAPGGYYTNGRTVCTAAGEKHLFRGVARPSLEWSASGDKISAADFQAMASWKANVVRIALNQDFWLSGAALYNSSYETVIDGAVKAAEAAGLDVILDLHWSDEGNLAVPVAGKTQDSNTNSNQQPMADVNSQEFWKEVATKYKGDGHVLFELYNEPHNVPWAMWLNGGMTTYQVVGMQQLYKTVRDTGANNIVIAGGLGFAFDLSGLSVSDNRIQGYNIMYASHPYKPQDAQPRWEGSFGYLATGDIAPVITTEFGDTTKPSAQMATATCTGQWNSDLIDFNTAHDISWTAWAWYVADPCGFPSVISDWSGTPSVQGAPVKAALSSFDYQPGGTPTLGTAGTGGTGGTGGSGGASGAGTGVAGAAGKAGTAGASAGGSGDTATGGTGGSASTAGASSAGASGAGSAGAASAGTGGTAGVGGTGGAAGVGGTGVST
jgi:endoglucanase